MLCIAVAMAVSVNDFLPTFERLTKKPEEYLRYDNLQYLFDLVSYQYLSQY